MPSEEDASGAVVPKSVQKVSNRSMPRNSLLFWKRRLYHKTKRVKGEVRVSAEWTVKIQHNKRREAFSTHETDRDKAAERAREIMGFLETNGWEATRARYKGAKHWARLPNGTVGAFLSVASERSGLKPSTLYLYSNYLRRIASGIARLKAMPGHKKRRGKVDSLSLALLNPDAIHSWRLRYVGKAGRNPLKARSAERSSASIIRCARALFSRATLLRMGLPDAVNPFAGVVLKAPRAPRYKSQVSPEWILSQAEKDLKDQQPQQFLALSLCLWGGLRKKEADLLTWGQVDFRGGRINIGRTKYFEPKTEESQREIDLPAAAMKTLAGFKKADKSAFVLDGLKPKLGTPYQFYRAEETWKGLLKWLREQGITDQKAVHSLRKESGSLIAQAYGIEAARQHLGHRDIETTSAHYVSKRGRREILL